MVNLLDWRENQASGSGQDERRLDSRRPSQGLSDLAKPVPFPVMLEFSPAVGPSPGDRLES